MNIEHRSYAATLNTHNVYHILYMLNLICVSASTALLWINFLKILKQKMLKRIKAEKFLKNKNTLAIHVSKLCLKKKNLKKIQIIFQLFVYIMSSY